jgi:hypothetical protein
MIPTPTWSPPESGRILGLTFPHESWKLAAPDRHKARVQTERSIGEEVVPMGLVVVANRSESAPATGRGDATRRESKDIAYNFFHEFALHAGRVSGPIPKEIRADKSLDKPGQRMPCTHKDPLVRFWNIEIDEMFQSTQP